MEHALHETTLATRWPALAITPSVQQSPPGSTAVCRPICHVTVGPRQAYTKNFIRIAWRRRTAKIGSLCLQPSNSGRLALVHTPPVSDVIAEPYISLPPSEPLRITDPSLKEFWSPWLNSCRTSHMKQHSPSRRKNFFLVWRGRKTGIFYKWSHCYASIRGYKDAKFKGFDSLQEAITL